MTKNSNREIVTLGDVRRSNKASARTKVEAVDEVGRHAVARVPDDGAQVLAELFETETNAANAAMDAKEARLDAHGYGGGDPEAVLVGLDYVRPAILPGRDPASLVGLAESVPSSDTAKNGDTDGSDPNAG